MLKFLRRKFGSGSERVAPSLGNSDAYQAMQPSAPRSSVNVPRPLVEQVSGFVSETAVEPFHGFDEGVDTNERELHLFGDGGGGADVDAMDDAALEEMLWDHFKDRELVLDWKAGAQVAAAVSVEVVDAQAVGQGKERVSDKALLVKFMAEVGITSIPLIRTGVSVAKLVAEVVKRRGEVSSREAVETFHDPNSERSRLQKFGQKGLVRVLARSIKTANVRIGSYTFDVVAGLVDVSSITKLLSSAVRGATVLAVMGLEAYEMKRINGILKKREEFTLKKFESMPLLGCYVLHEFQPMMLMGLFDAFHYDDVPGQVQKNVYDRLSLRDREQAIDFYVKEIEPLRKDAFNKIRVSPFAFTSELDRRRERSYGAAAVEASPEFIKNANEKAKADAQNDKDKYYAELKAQRPMPVMKPVPSGVGDAGQGMQGKGKDRVHKTISQRKMRQNIKNVEDARRKVEETRMIMGPDGQRQNVEACAKFILDRESFIKMRNRYNAQAARRSPSGFDRQAKAYVAARAAVKPTKISGSKT